MLTFGVIVLPISFRPAPSLLNIGDVAFQDINTPRALSFVSEYLTEKSRSEAEKKVSPVYLPADPAINRKQIESLKTIVNFISTIKTDEFSDDNQKIQDLNTIELITLSDTSKDDLLSISNERWELIKSESLYLLEQVMRTSIRDDQVTDIQRNLKSQIGLDFNENESNIILDLVSPLIIANSLYSNEKTAEAIILARDSIVPVTKEYAAGETIVSSGEVIDAQKWEALQELGLTEPLNRAFDYTSAGLLVIVMIGLFVFYLRRKKQTNGQKIQGLFIIIILFFIFLTSARLVIPNHTIIPYLFPIAAFGLTISSVFDYELGIITALVISVLSAYNQPNSIDLAFYYFLPSAISIFILGRGRRIHIFFLAGLALSLSGSAVVLSHRLLTSFLDISGTMTLIGASFANGVLSISLSLIAQYVISQLLGKTTALQLMDLSRPDHPLLQELLIKAPGTYQHCLQVANLAEQAAKEVQGDALLIRVGALYHDVGKTMNPGFFIENQLPGKMDTHEDMDPVLSAATIIQHVSDGIKLAKKHRLPPQIQSFIQEHHGKTLTRYQYIQAVEENGNEEKIEKSMFQYPGPIPQSKETAILMLADGCEARMRSENPDNIDDIGRIIKESVDFYLKDGQLSNSALTLNDLQIVTRSFIRTLQNTYHHRIKYPEPEQKG